ELSRPKVQGWVKVEGEKTLEEMEEERRQAFKATVMARKAEAQEATPTLKTTRQLPSIPKEGVSEQTQAGSEGEFCPFCGKDLGFLYCPYCGKRLPHSS
ncbi:MAG: hypothetical protein JSV62_12135, partial [Promethearchaeota archaeon]